MAKQKQGSNDINYVDGSSIDGITVTLEHYNAEALQEALNELGYDINDFDKIELGAILSYALGFVTYDKHHVKDMLEVIDK